MIENQASAAPLAAVAPTPADALGNPAEPVSLLHQCMILAQRMLNALAANPILFKHRDTIIVKFGPISGIAAFAGFFSSLVAFQSFSLPRQFIVWWIILAPLSMLAGSIILPKIFHLARSPRYFIENLRTVSFTFFGGFAGAFVAGVVLSRALDVSALVFCDAACFCLPLIHGLSRFACLNYGCCHGRRMISVCLPAVIYTHPMSKAVRVSGLAGVRLHPVQIYEMALNAGLQALLIYAAFSVPYQGAIAGMYLLGYASIRALLRPLRFKPADALNPHPHYEAILIGAFYVAGAAFLYASLVLTQMSHRSFLPVYISHALALAPAIAVMSLAVAAVYGIHRKKVGQWL